MEFRVLGPLEVVEGGRTIDLGGPRQRALLACLLLHANEVVAAERLVEELWGGRADAAPLQVAVSRLRKSLGGDVRLLTRSGGYVLRVETGEYDRDEFERLAAEGRQQLETGRAQEAATSLRRALALWRGPPFADFLYEPFAQAEIARLEELRLTCLEARIDADLALGRHAELVGELEALGAEHPLRERLGAQLMLALYRSGRQAEALDVYQTTRQRLVEELGIEPGNELRALHQAILRHDAALDLPQKEQDAAAQREAAPSAEPERTAREHAAPVRLARKTVTVLVGGLAGQAAARGRDPELRRQLGERSFEAIAPVLERHGAAVERLRDDRVMGLFGMPAAHEDDALRAVRAAVEVRATHSGDGDTFRIGIATGEVLTGDPGEPPAAGEPIDLAAYLQQANGPAEIVIAEDTRRLVPDAVLVEPVELAGPDGTGPLPAWAVVGLAPDAPPFARRFDAPLIGRDGELAQLRQAFERARRERRAQLFTIFGEAGIGKTRLVHELARSVEGEAAVLTGRCLSYGEGITYWPVREMVIQACGERELRELLGDDPDAGAIAERLESAVGTGTSGAVGEEIFWAFRKLAESLAHHQPLVLVFEDVHWAEPTLLDLIEYLADWVRSDPVLLVCLARPELLDERATWAGGKLNATSILLEPLSEEESTDLIGALAAGTELSPQASRRIAEAAEGNPLFLEQMLAMLAEQDDGAAEIAVPPAIQALLAARLDQLTPEERDVIGRASVEGEVFHVEGVLELCSLETRETVSAQLASLVRKELIRPEPAALPGHEAFGFRHALIRDAAYASLPKRARSDLHERHAAWLERTLGDRATEGEEFLAYHLEQAHRYRVELGVEDNATEALAVRAGELLASAGRRAFMRGDWPATVNLFERALALLEQDAPLRREVLPDLALALFQMGDAEKADAIAIEAMATADKAGDRAGRARAAVTHTYCGVYLRPEQLDVEAMRREAHAAFAVFDELDDDRGRTRAIFNLDIAAWASGDTYEFGRSAERAVFYARRAGIRPDELECCAGYAWSHCWGSTPASAAREQIERFLLGTGSGRSLEALAAIFLALLDGIDGRLAEAQEGMQRGRHGLAEVGLHHWVRISSLLATQLAMLAADPVLAERVLREALDLPGAATDRWFSAFAQAELVRALLAQGRQEDAFALTERVEATPPLVDLYIRIRRYGARALALTSVGRLDDADRLAREAVELARPTDLLIGRGDTLVDLAEILALAGRPEHAVPALEEAVSLYERKGNVVSAARARAQLQAIG